MKKVLGLAAAAMVAVSTANAAGILISVDEAKDLVNKPDVRFVCGDDEKTFQAGHIPGAVNAYAHDLHYLNDIKKCNGLPMCEANAAKLIGELGISNKTKVIAYDDGKGPNASGVWFFMYLYGVDDVKMLDGGFATWKAKGLPVETGPAKKPAPAKFTVKLRKNIIATKEEVLQATKDPAKYVILDARSFNEYVGKDLKEALEAPGKHIQVARGGHIPGAKFFEWKKLAGNPNGEADKPIFKDPEKMKKELEKAGITPDKTVISYCHVGIGRGSFVFAALQQLGYKNAKVYVGSWDEWGNDSSLPLEK